MNKYNTIGYLVFVVGKLNEQKKNTTAPFLP